MTTTTIAGGPLLGITQAEYDRFISTETEKLKENVVANGTLIYPGQVTTVHPKQDNYFVRSIDSPGMAASLEELSDLWAARFGNGWVQAATLLEDEFWSIALERLHKKGYVEDIRVSVPDFLDQVWVYRLCK